jgi:hypothetical protein
MMHPLLHLIATQPHLLAEHAVAYADLLGEELGSASAQWKRRAALGAMALCLLGVGVVLGGVAIMLWAVVPAESMRAPWALILVPLVPLAGSIACMVAARSDAKANPFETVRMQVKADVAMLREVSSP